MKYYPEGCEKITQLVLFSDWVNVPSLPLIAGGSGKSFQG